MAKSATLPVSQVVVPAPWTPDAKGQTGISLELYRWVNGPPENQGAGVTVPANVVVGTGGPDDPLQVYEPCPPDSNQGTRYTCPYFQTFTLEYYVTHGSTRITSKPARTITTASGV